MQNLNTLIPAGSGYQIQDATTIDDSGRIVACTTSNRALLLAPSRPPLLRALVSPGIAPTICALLAIPAADEPATHNRHGLQRADHKLFVTVCQWLIGR